MSDVCNLTVSVKIEIGYNLNCQPFGPSSLGATRKVLHPVAGRLSLSLEEPLSLPRRHSPPPPRTRGGGGGMGDAEEAGGALVAGGGAIAIPSGAASPEPWQPRGILVRCFTQQALSLQLQRFRPLMLMLFVFPTIRAKRVEQERLRMSLPLTVRQDLGTG